jgi:cobalt/nickel transport system permease protein
MMPGALNTFAARTTRDTLAFFKDALFAEETACRPGLLQALDPRVKIAAILALLLLALFTRSLVVLGALYLLSLILAVLSRINLLFFLKRTWIFIPLFSLMIAIPALFSIISPGRTVFTIGILNVTHQGILAAGFFIGRVITSVSLTVLLGMTTRHFALLKALRAFGVPQVFVMVLGMCYRYIYLFVEILENTHRAIQSRIGSRMHFSKGQRLVTWNIANLWTRSHQLNEQVYNAMVSRGFRGEAVALGKTISTTKARSSRRDF